MNLLMNLMTEPFNYYYCVYDRSVMCVILLHYVVCCSPYSVHQMCHFLMIMNAIFVNISLSSFRFNNFESMLNFFVSYDFKLKQRERKWKVSWLLDCFIRHYSNSSFILLIKVFFIHAKIDMWVLLILMWTEYLTCFVQFIAIFLKLRWLMTNARGKKFFGDMLQILIEITFLKVTVNLKISNLLI